MTLYELTGTLLELAQMAEDPDLDPQVLADTMEAVEGEFSLKAEGYVKVLRSLDAEEAALRAEADKLTKRAQAISNNASRIKDRLQHAMEATGQTNIKTDLFRLRIQNTQGTLVIDAPDEVSPEYLIPQAPKIDKMAVRKDLKAGLNLPWCHITPGKSLIIR